jgi:integrase
MDGFSLYRRAKKTYYVKFLEDGVWKKRSLRTSKKSEAIRRVENLRNVLRPSLQRITLGAFKQRFLQHAELNLSSAGARRYKQVISRFCDFLSGDDRVLDAITVRECDAFVSLRLQSIKTTSVNTEIRHLRAFFSRAVRWEYLIKNPFDKIKLLKIPESHPVYLTKEEFGILFHAIEEQWLRLAVVLSCTCGLRSGEAIALKWEDIDFDKRIVHVRNTATFQTKSRRNRVVPIPPSVVPILIEARKTATSNSVLHEKSRQIDSYLLSHFFKAYIRRLGLDSQLHFHSCRHTAATWWVSDNVPLPVCQKWLGHSSIAMVMVYAHAQPMKYEEYASRIVLPSLN